MLDVNDHNDQVYTGFEPTFLFSADKVKQSALTAEPWKQISNRNSGKYIDAGSNYVITVQKIMKELLKLECRLYVFNSSLMKHKTIISLKNTF